MNRTFLLTIFLFLILIAKSYASAAVGLQAKFQIKEEKIEKNLPLELTLNIKAKQTITLDKKNKICADWIGKKVQDLFYVFHISECDWLSNDHRDLVIKLGLVFLREASEDEIIFDMASEKVSLNVINVVVFNSLDTNNNIFIFKIKAPLPWSWESTFIILILTIGTGVILFLRFYYRKKERLLKRQRQDFINDLRNDIAKKDRVIFDHLWNKKQEIKEMFSENIMIKKIDDCFALLTNYIFKKSWSEKDKNETFMLLSNLLNELEQITKAKK